MATNTTEQDRLLEQARGLAVALEAENALVASLVLALDERERIMHIPHAIGRKNHECPTCQLLAWARGAA